ncbi:TRAP transporter small permease subunit [Oceanospirillum sediminis]|uniref:TRAP transporter small permease protein n=1 Tax=Oceanospirillum sediminis TaxID=2760088 RepID=A0A839IXK1_9GAMM|nr:TRAP transporter small permease subunit [Oceanospirillum sediminis]MBB1489532.1 TRAP transporter small permease subunit [Oceanospirillum sediminis]
MSGISRLLNYQDEISEFIGKASSWMCLAMIGVLLYEIAARYLFLSPTSWAHESTTMLYGSFCMFAGIYTHKHHGHVRSEVVYHLFDKRGRAILDVITGCVVLIMFGVFFVAACEFAYDSWQSGELSSKSTWAPPIYPFKTMLPIGVGLIWLQGLVHLIRDIQVALNYRPDK